MPKNFLQTFSLDFRPVLIVQALICVVQTSYGILLLVFYFFTIF